MSRTIPEKLSNEELLAQLHKLEARVHGRRVSTQPNKGKEAYDKVECCGHIAHAVFSELEAKRLQQDIMVVEGPPLVTNEDYPQIVSECKKLCSELVWSQTAQRITRYDGIIEVITPRRYQLLQATADGPRRIFSVEF